MAYKEIDFEATDDYCGLFVVKKSTPVCNNLKLIELPKLGKKAKFTVKGRGKNKREFIDVVIGVYNDFQFTVKNEKSGNRESFTKTDILINKVSIENIGIDSNKVST